MLPSAKMLTLYAPSMSVCDTFQKVTMEVSWPVYSAVFFMEHCSVRFS